MHSCNLKVQFLLPGTGQSFLLLLCGFYSLNSSRSSTPASTDIIGHFVSCAIRMFQGLFMSVEKVHDVTLSLKKKFDILER